MKMSVLFCRTIVFDIFENMHALLFHFTQFTHSSLWSQCYTNEIISWILEKILNFQKKSWIYFLYSSIYFALNFYYVAYIKIPFLNKPKKLLSLGVGPNCDVRMCLARNIIFYIVEGYMIWIAEFSCTWHNWNLSLNCIWTQPAGVGCWLVHKRAFLQVATILVCTICLCVYVYKDSFDTIFR